MDNGYFQRLKIERFDLNGRVERLEKYLEVKAQLENIGQIHITLLNMQLKAMKEYLVLLDVRIALLANTQ